MNEKMRILVVDDNQDFAEIVESILQEAGYEATAVYDGGGAIELFSRERFDAALLDYKLPDIDGLELRHRLAELSDAEFIIISAYDGLEPVDQAIRENQIAGYETKPLNMDSLLALLRQIAQRGQRG